jgi:hypothetical protein
MSLILSGDQALIPISVLTGFLGSGKTTVLNRLVRDPAMNRALVVINEFGAVGLDHELVARSDEDLVVEMMGGCLCCTIRGDLLRTLRDAPFRFARDGKCWFDCIVIETTGLADPAPILHTLMTDDRLQTLYRLDGVIATVDAATGMATLDAQEESVKQAAVAGKQRAAWLARAPVQQERTRVTVTPDAITVINLSTRSGRSQASATSPQFPRQLTAEKDQS